jgi:hypothetical protein
MPPVDIDRSPPRRETPMLRRTLVLGALALVAALPASRLALAQAAGKPSDVVKRIYTFSAGKTGAWDTPSAYFDAGMRKATFTRAFTAAIEEEDGLLNGDIGAIDFDPISNSQDPAVQNLVITDVETGPSAARVEARFRMGADASAPQGLVSYRLIIEGGQWRVDDIVPRGDDGADVSIRQALADSIRDLKAAAPAKAP